MDPILLSLFPNVALVQSHPPYWLLYSICAAEIIAIASIAQAKLMLALFGVTIHVVCVYIVRKQTHRDCGSMNPEAPLSSASSLYFKGNETSKNGVNLFSPSPTQKQPLILFSPSSEK